MQNSEKIRNIKDVNGEKKEQKEEIKEKSKRIISVILVECIISLIILLSLIIIKFTYEELFIKIKEYYNVSPFIMLKEEEGINIIE